MSTSAENYLADLGKEMLALAREVPSDTGNNEFQKGRQMAFYEVLSLMKQQANAFGLADELGLKGVNLEELLR